MDQSFLKRWAEPSGAVNDRLPTMGINDFGDFQSPMICFLCLLHFPAVKLYTTESSTYLSCPWFGSCLMGFYNQNRIDLCRPIVEVLCFIHRMDLALGIKSEKKKTTNIVSGDGRDCVALRWVKYPKIRSTLKNLVYILIERFIATVFS